MPFLKASPLCKRAVSPGGDISAVTQEDVEEHTIEKERGRDAATVGGACAPTVGASLPASSSNGLGHHGEPARSEQATEGRPTEEEHDVQEENEERVPVTIVRAPRTPSQSERKFHEASHLPHAEWCENCVRGRGRNKPHKSRSKRTPPRFSFDATEYPWGNQMTHGPSEEEKVPRVSLDDFLLGAGQVRRITRNAADKMSTKQLKRNLRTAKLPINGTREELVARYDKFVRGTLAEEGMSPRLRAKTTKEELRTTQPSL